jgi:hypothetical protein
MVASGAFLLSVAVFPRMGVIAMKMVRWAASWRRQLGDLFSTAFRRGSPESKPRSRLRLNLGDEIEAERVLLIGLR